MRKYFVPFVILMSVVMMACTGSGPTGEPATDAKHFASSLYKAYESENVDAAKAVIKEYYDFYKNQPKEKVGEFMKMVKDEWEPLFQKSGFDEDKWTKMMNEADVDGNMDRLYRQTM